MSASFVHGRAQGPATGILLCNLGSPDAPTAEAVRRYLAQFLSDPRVVEIPRLLWWPILHGIVLRTRPAKSAAKYATVWTPEGSPLKTITAKQSKLLQGWLGERGHRVQVDWAMRYGSPSIAEGLDRLRAQGAQRILVFNAYPQYCAATTASVMDEVGRWLQAQRWQPELRTVHQYHDEPAYIDALASSLRAHWQREGGPARHLVMSFHGMPERTLHLGDPYHCQAHKTARLLAERLGLAPGSWRIAFQSRFGRAKWLGPSTETVLQELGRLGGEVDVICPGFAADCLETLEEIAVEGAETFRHAGGGRLRYAPCLNDSSEGMAALTAIAERQLAGWPTREPAPTEAQLAEQQARARALGAPA